MNLPVAPTPRPAPVSPQTPGTPLPATFGNHRVQPGPTPGAQQQGLACSRAVAPVDDSYTPLHRQSLDRLDTGLLHERLALLCDRLPADSQQRLALEDRLVRRLSSRSLFHSLAQQMRDTPYFSCREEKTAFAMRTSLLCEPLYSPDGTHLVVASDPLRNQGEGCFLFRQAAGCAGKAAWLDLPGHF